MRSLKNLMYIVK